MEYEILGYKLKTLVTSTARKTLTSLHLPILIILLMTLLTPHPLLAQSLADKLVSKRILYKGLSYDIVRISAATRNIDLYWKSSNNGLFGNFKQLKEYIETQKQKLLFATNAGIYEIGQSPLGLHVENGVEQVPLNRKRGLGNFYMQPNGVFYITKEGRAHIKLSSQYRQSATSLKLATQSGPILVTNNNLHPLFKRNSPSAKIRNGVGINDKGEIVFVISNARVNFYNFAALFRDHLHCKDALYLDGSISKMYAPALNRHQLDGVFSGIIAITQ